MEILELKSRFQKSGWKKIVCKNSYQIEFNDPFNEIDIAALHFTFIPLINEKLDAWRHAWSKHRVRTIKTSPLRLWVAGQIHCPLDDMSEDQLCNFGVEGILTDEEVDERRAV